MKKYIMIVLCSLFTMNAYAGGWSVGVKGWIYYEQVPNGNTIKMSLTTDYGNFGNITDLVGSGKEGGLGIGSYPVTSCFGLWEASKKFSEGGPFLYSLSFFEFPFYAYISIKTMDNTPILTCTIFTGNLLVLGWDVSGDVTGFQYIPNK